MSTLWRVHISKYIYSSQSSDHIPIENGCAKGTSAARPPEEHVPDGVAESRRLGSGAKASGTGRTTEGQRDNLALSLAGLNLRSEELAVRQRRAWEIRVIRWVASLLSDINTVLKNTHTSSA